MSARPFKYELYSSCAPIHRKKYGLTHPAMGSSHSCWSGGATRRSSQSLSPARFSQRPGLRSTERLWRRRRPKTGSRLRQASHAAREASDGRDGSSNAWESSMCHIGEIVGDTLCSLTKRTGDTLVPPVPKHPGDMLFLSCTSLQYTLTGVDNITCRS